MALTLKSLATAARRRAERAHGHVEEARQELAKANEELDSAIPSGDTDRIRQAHERTQCAEQAVVEASDDLDVVGELLSEAPEFVPPAAAASGEGVRSLVKSLRQARR